MRHALTIAGSDSCGGAGIQADLKTFSAHGVYGMSVITAVTAQNTCGVLGVQDVTPELVSGQIQAIFEDIRVDGLKIGMVSKIETIEAIAEGMLFYRPSGIVLDPVMVSKSGYHLLRPEAREALISKLLPLAAVVTPNIPEAEVLTGMCIKSLEDMKKAAVLIHDMGPDHVLVKGGHMDDTATDVLYDGSAFRYMSSKRISTKNTHGTGCTLSAAIAANLARGASSEAAIEKAKEYITYAILYSFELGKGVGPTNHFWQLYGKAGMLDE